MHGLLQVVSLMLALGGAGIDKDASAPSADTVLTYAVDDADVILYLDTAAVLPRNYQVLVGLVDDASIRADPELLGMAKKLKANAEGIRAMGKSIAGLDLVDDITSVTVFVDVHGGSPQKLVVIRGSIPTDLLKKVASVSGGGTTGSIDGRPTLALDAETFLGTAKDGSLLIGPETWVTPRVDDDWKPPARKKGSAAATIAKYLDDKPFALAAAKVDAADAATLGSGFVADLAAAGELAVVALHRDGVRFYWKDRTKAHLARMSQAVDGAIAILRAAHLAPRGFAELCAAELDSYAGQSTDLDALIKRKDDLVAAIEDNTGDGSFTADVVTDKKARTITVKATGASLTDVVPAALVLPAVLAALFL